MSVVIRRLEERDEVVNFDCGDEPLNNYLKRHAWSNQAKSSIGVSYVAVDESAPRAVLGYFTLAMSSVAREAFPNKYVRGLPPYDLPLILLARLAVDRRFAGRGLGHALISEVFRITLQVADEVGCRCIVTDAYRDRISWTLWAGPPPVCQLVRPNGLYELLYELLLKAMRSGAWLHNHSALSFNNLHFLIRIASPCNSAVNRRVVGSSPT